MKLELASKTALEIEALRNVYRVIAKRGALLFFLLSDMAAVNPMYQYSLGSYLTVFVYALRKSMPDVIIKTRLRNIITTLTKMVYEYGCTGEAVGYNNKCVPSSQPLT